MVLSSSHSMQVSLAAVKSGKAGLDAHRQNLLDKALKTGDWASFERDSIELKDLAYLTAKVGDEFALLRGKKEDILYHGECTKCRFLGELEQGLMSHRLELVGHAHPGEPIPIPSREDRQMLEQIGQARSKIISARTGRIADYGPDRFEPL